MNSSCIQASCTTVLQQASARKNPRALQPTGSCQGKRKISRLHWSHLETARVSVHTEAKDTHKLLDAKGSVSMPRRASSSRTPASGSELLVEEVDSNLGLHANFVLELTLSRVSLRIDFALQSVEECIVEFSEGTILGSIYVGMLPSWVW